MRGTLRLEDGNLCIKGVLEGDVVTRGRVVVAEEGVVSGSIQAASIRVAGTVDGDLIASDELLIREGSEVEGTLYATHLDIQPGAEFQGAVRQLDTEEEPPLQGRSGDCVSGESSPHVAPQLKAADRTSAPSMVDPPSSLRKLVEQGKSGGTSSSQQEAESTESVPETQGDGDKQRGEPVEAGREEETYDPNRSEEPPVGAGPHEEPVEANTDGEETGSRSTSSPQREEYDEGSDSGIGEDEFGLSWS